MSVSANEIPGLAAVIKDLAKAIIDEVKPKEISPLEDEKLTIEQCAQLIGISAARLNALIALPDSTFPVQRLSRGGTPFVLRKNLEKWYGTTTLSIAKLKNKTPRKGAK